MRKDQGVVRGEGGELVRSGHEGLSRQLGDGRRHALAELGVRVEARAHRGPAGGEFVEPAEDQAQALQIGVELGHVRFW